MSENDMTAEFMAAMAVFELGLRLIAATGQTPTPEQLADVRSRADVSDAAFDALLASVQNNPTD